MQDARTEVGRLLLSRASLRAKVTILLLGIGLGPLLVSGVMHENRAIDSGKQSARRRYAQTARFAAYTFDTIFSDIQADLRQLAQRFPIERLDPVAIDRALDEGRGPLTAVDFWNDIAVFAQLHEESARTFLALPDGRIFFTYPFHNVQPPPDLSALAWFQRMPRTGGLAIGDLVPLTSPGRPQIISVVPLPRGDGVLGGYVGVIVDRGRLEEIVTEASSFGSNVPLEDRGDATEAVMLVSPEGTFAAHTDPSMVGQHAPDHLLALRAPGTQEVRVLDRKLLVARAEVGRSGWYVMLLTATQLAYRDVYMLIWLLTGIIVLTLLLVLLFSDWVATVLLRPVLELERGAEMIGAGALDYRIELSEHSHDELGRLAHAFNDMGDSLLRSRRDVEAYSRNLEVANQELDAMVYAITHDLKKSLRGIEAFATFLDEDYARQMDAEGVDLLKSIVQNVHRIEKLADDLIGLVEHERERSDSSRFSMGDLLREARERALEANMGDVVLQPAMPEITADRARLMLVFSNLIANGLKFNRSARPRVEVRWSDQGMYWEFEVIDNGIGIDPRYHGQIFELFSRLNPKDEYEGSGTGLNLARRIIEEHRGTIAVDSRPGQGSRFVVTLPKDPSLLTSPGVIRT